MGLNEYVRSFGIKNIAEVSRRSGVQVRTLHNWYANRQALLRLLLLGIAAEDTARQGGDLLRGMERLAQTAPLPPAE